MKHIIKNMIYEYRYLIAILVGVISGTLLCNTVLCESIRKGNLFGYDFKITFLEMTLDKLTLLKYVGKTRLKEFCIFTLLLSTPLYGVITYGIMFAAGFVISVMVTGIVMNNGIAGVLIYVFSIMPQYILYIITVSLMVRYYRKVRNIRKTVMLIILSLVMIIIGVYSETYISPIFVKMLLNHISYSI